MLQHKSTPIEQAFELFQLDNRARRLTPTTVQFYHDTLTPFLVFCKRSGAASAADVTPAIIRAYLVAMQERDLAAHTVHGAARSIRTFLNFLVREEVLTESPMRKVTMPRVDRRILPAFTVEEVRAILDVCTTERDTAAVLFLLDTGLRVAEFCALNGADVDLAAGLVHVRLGKGRKGRTAYLGARAQKQMLRYFMTVGAPRPAGPVWRAQGTDKRLMPSGLRQALKRLGRLAMIPHCTPHTFRRTFALWSLRSGMPLPQLQRLMGHEDLTTLQRYLKLLDTDLRAAHDAYGAVDTFL